MKGEVVFPNPKQISLSVFLLCAARELLPSGQAAVGEEIPTIQAGNLIVVRPSPRSCRL